MNRYRKAYENFGKHRININKQISELQKTINNLDTDAFNFYGLNDLQELVERETPMRPIWKQSFYTHKDVKIPFCRICEQNLSDYTTFFHRCRNPRCEQLVDWSEEDE